MIAHRAIIGKSRRVFDVREAYVLYVIGAINAAVGWLIMKVMVKDRH